MYENICKFIDREMTDLDHRINSQGKLNMQEIQYADLLAHTKKSMLTVDAMENYGGYNDGYSKGYNDGYNRAESYHDDSYNARGRGSGAKRDSMGRYADDYSADGGYNADYREYRHNKDMVGELHKLMQEAPNEHIKKKYQDFISEMEKMV